MPVQPEVVVVNPSVGTSVTVYVPAGTTPSLTPSASNLIVRPPTRKLKSLGGLDDPTTTFRTWRRSSGTSSAVFVMVQTGIVGCGDERTTSVQPEVVVVKPATGGSVTVYVPAGSFSSLSPSASKLVVWPPTVKLNAVGGRSEPTTTFRTWSFNDRRWRTFGPVLEVVPVAAAASARLDAVALVADERVRAVPGEDDDVARARREPAARDHGAALVVGDAERPRGAGREVRRPEVDAVALLELVPSIAARVGRRDVGGVAVRRVGRLGRIGGDAAVLVDRLTLVVPVLAGVVAALVALRLVVEGRNDVLRMAAVALAADDAVDVGRVRDVLAVARRVADVDGLPALGLRLLLAEPGPGDACGQAGEHADEQEDGGSPHRLHESISPG